MSARREAVPGGPLSPALRFEVLKREGFRYQFTAPAAAGAVLAADVGELLNG